ncbi:hypothetical protein AVEN_68731-1 [Araneus ventricosus]|uniref:Uncharacterized protein n=1 Tax=Araneus ventricosus TaxID=182803 RepID=A0A4Y2WBQ9_ARAVE|nr:hypothetical protein AVEN_68731-1 [Araneus ventricosus]
MVITPPEGVATMVIHTSRKIRDHGYPTPPEGSRPWLSHLQKGRDHDYHTSRVATMLSPGVATMVITPPEGSRYEFIHLQRVATMVIPHLQRVATMVITLQGSRPWLSHLQKGRDHGYSYLRGVATMMLLPPEGSRPWSSHTSRVATIIITPPESRDHCYHTSESRP